MISFSLSLSLSLSLSHTHTLTHTQTHTLSLSHALSHSNATHALTLFLPVLMDWLLMINGLQLSISISHITHSPTHGTDPTQTNSAEEKKFGQVANLPKMKNKSINGSRTNQKSSFSAARKFFIIIWWRRLIFFHLQTVSRIQRYKYTNITNIQPIQIWKRYKNTTETKIVQLIQTYNRYKYTTNTN